MNKIKFLQEKINKTIQKEVIEPKFDIAGLYEPVKYTLQSGGKRIRPALLLLSCSFFEPNIEKALFPALGIEVFHNFTLLHDDIMDNSILRRNKATVHAKWNANTAILSGDAMCILAYRYMAQCPPQCFQEVHRIFTQTALEVCEGQQYDMEFETKQSVTEQEYLRMIELKTSVLIAASLKIGAVIGGASETDAEALYQFGKNIGIAFQLQDDYLDVYGDTTVFGKKTGGDIVANKKTFLLIKALERAKGETWEKLNHLLQSKNMDRNQKVTQVKHIYDILNIKTASQAKMETFYTKALKCLDEAGINDDNKTTLKNLANQLMKRRF